MLKSLTIRREGNKILLLSGGLLIAEMSWEKADELADKLRGKARLAEEEEKAGRIVQDNAILFRAGVPFGLSNRVDIIKETIKNAIWNRALRRYMPGGVKSKEVFGTPIIRHRPPKG